MEAAETRFRVMGCAAHVIVVGGTPEAAPLVAGAEQRLEALEASWTRFEPSSFVSRLNSGSGEPVIVDQDTRSLLLRSRDAWRLTNGLFDPTVLPSLVHAGYQHGLDATGNGGAPLGGPVGPAPGMEGILIDSETGSVRLPVGVEIDPGGIGKGLAADLVADELIERGASGAMVNIGGDLRVAGMSPSTGGWTVSLEDPFDAEAAIARLTVVDGGVATTTPQHRRWRVAEERGIHVIDPRSGIPVRTDVASVTVLAAQAWMAEAVTKAVAVAGADEGLEIVENAGLAGIIIRDDGRIRLSSRAGAFL